MAEPMIIPAADLDRAVYVAVAGARDDAKIDILAGVAQQIVFQHPDISTAQLSGAISELHDTIASNRPARPADLARENSALLMSRLLARVVPALTSPMLRAAARDYTRAFLKSYRRGVSSLRQVAPIDLQFDRFGEVERFRRETWQQLHDQARARPAVANAVDEGPIAEALGVRTTQDAMTALGLVELEPLTTFVADRIQPGGGILVTREDIDSTLATAGSTITSVTSAYAANLVELNKAQDAAGEDTHHVPGEPPSDFEQAITKAEEMQKELDKDLKKATTGVKYTFGVLSFAAGKLFGDNDLATEIDEYGTIVTKVLDGMRDFSEAAVYIAKAIEGLDDISLDEFVKGAAIGFNVGMVAAVIQMFGLFGKPKPPTQVILEQLRVIRQEIAALRDEMRVRFDRVEKRLNKMYVGILNRLDEIDFELGQIGANVEELQRAVYDLHSELQRLNRNVYGFLEAAHRRELVEAINGFLQFRERTGEALSVEDFRTAENKFFSWGNDYAKDVLQAGLDVRRFEDEFLLEEITALPLASNVNYLRRFPAERFNLPALSAVRLANPFDWIVAGEAYAQLCEESPAQTVSPDRVAALMAVGEALGTSLARIADDALFAALAEHYKASFGALKAEIAAFYQLIRCDPPREGCGADWQLFGIDLWAGVDQEPATHPLGASFVELHRCDGRDFDASHDTVPVPASIGRDFDYSILRPYMIASNLSNHTVIPGIADDLEVLTSCVSARWEVQESEPAGFANKVRVVYRLVIAVNIRYGDNIVYTHGYRTTENLQMLVPRDKFEAGTFDPATDPSGKDPHALLVPRDQNPGLWSKLDTFPATHRLVNAPLRAATVSLLERKLILLQRGFYSEVVRRFMLAGDAIQRAGQVLNGSKLLWQAFVTVGLPIRIEANELLRTLLFGSGAILGGSDADGEDSLLDDVQDLYTFFSLRDEDPPPQNIADEIEALVIRRAGRLSAILAAIVAAIEESDEPEPPELFAPTLLRLRLISTP